VVHYGTIASSNQVMRDAAERDRVSAEFGGVLCFESVFTCSRVDVDPTKKSIYNKMH